MFLIIGIKACNEHGNLVFAGIKRNSKTQNLSEGEYFEFKRVTSEILKLYFGTKLYNDVRKGKRKILNFYPFPSPFGAS